MPEMDIAALTQFLIAQPLLALAILAIFLCVFGGMLRPSLPAVGGLFRGIGNLGLVAALLLTVAQAARLTTGADIAFPQIGLPKQTVEGSETRVPMAPDGHFWINARLNGVEGRFLVDTGATITALSPAMAQAAGVDPMPVRQGVAMKTANGTIVAELALIDELRFGNVVARDLDAVIAPGMGDANVLGMNLLSRLASWRVEGRTLILVPNNPQSESEI